MGQNGEDRQINYSRARLTIGAKALGPPKNSALRNASKSPQIRCHVVVVARTICLTDDNGTTDDATTMDDNNRRVLSTTIMTADIDTTMTDAKQHVSNRPSNNEDTGSVPQ